MPIAAAGRTPRRLTSLVFLGHDAHAAAAAVELHNARSDREKSVITPLADSLAGMELVAYLADEDAAGLKALFAGDIQVRVIELDGWLALGAQLPPKEKRGLVLIDPPFEEPGEFERMVAGLKSAQRRWPGGIYTLWYPIKDRGAVADFRAALAASGIPRVLDISFEIRGPSAAPTLDGCGMVVVNPPYTLQGEMQVILPALAKVLGDGRAARFAIQPIAGE